MSGKPRISGASALAAAAGGAALVRDVGRHGARWKETQPGRRAGPRQGRLQVAGRHLRLGASLARLETRVAFEELLSRFPDFTFDETRVERAYSGNVRGLAKLPLRIERRARYRAWHAPDLETF